MSYKILYIQGVTRMGGAIESLLLLANNLSSERFIPKIVTSATGAFTGELEKNGIDYETAKMEMWRKAKGFLSRSSTVKKLVNYARKEKISLVHCNTLWDNPYGAEVAGELGIPLICHVRNTFFHDKIKKYKLSSSQGIICVSRKVSAGFNNWEGKGKVQVVYNGVDTAKFNIENFDQKALRSEFSINHDIPVIGLVGRVSPEKGQLEILKAVSLLKEKIPSFKVLIVGETSKKETDYMAFLKNKASHLGVAENVIFTGFRRDISRITSIFDIAVFPSLESANEGFGRGIIEAMAMRKPVIGTYTGGIPEVIEDGESGLIVEPGDIDALAKNILRLLEDMRLKDKFSENGYRRVCRKFSVESYVAGVEKVYSELQQ